MRRAIVVFYAEAFGGWTWAYYNDPLKPVGCDDTYETRALAAKAAKRFKASVAAAEVILADKSQS